MARSKSLAVVALLALSAPACAHVQAKTPVAMAGLATPEPPARVIVPPPVADEPGPTTPPATAVAPRPRDPGTPPRPAPTPPPPTPAAAIPEAPPARLLQTTAKPAEVEKEIRAVLSTAEKDLDRAANRPLSADGKVQYDSARGFIRQALQALTAKNLPLARGLADKAASLASQLAR